MSSLQTGKQITLTPFLFHFGRTADTIGLRSYLELICVVGNLQLHNCIDENSKKPDVFNGAQQADSSPVKVDTGLVNYCH